MSLSFCFMFAGMFTTVFQREFKRYCCFWCFKKKPTTTTANKPPPPPPLAPQFLPSAPNPEFRRLWQTGSGASSSLEMRTTSSSSSSNTTADSRQHDKFSSSASTAKSRMLGMPQTKGGQGVVFSDGSAAQDMVGLYSSHTLPPHSHSWRKRQEFHEIYQHKMMRHITADSKNRTIHEQREYIYNQYCWLFDRIL